MTIFFFYKLHTHLVGLKPITSPFIPLLWEEAVSIELIARQTSCSSDQIIQIQSMNSKEEETFFFFNVWNLFKKESLNIWATNSTH